jgi:hypothetical protein
VLIRNVCYQGVSSPLKSKKRFVRGDNLGRSLDFWSAQSPGKKLQLYLGCTLKELANVLASCIHEDCSCFEVICQVSHDGDHHGNRPESEIDWCKRIFVEPSRKGGQDTVVDFFTRVFGGGTARCDMAVREDVLPYRSWGHLCMQKEG